MFASLGRWFKRAWPSVRRSGGQWRRAISRWAKYPQDGVTVPRWIRLLLVGSAILVVSVIFGVTTAQTNANFGPHDARYEITVDSMITVDVGPLGTMQLDSPLPLGLGARATIEEIPADLTALDQSQTLGALGQDVEQYLQFFAAPTETIDLVAKLLIENALLRTVIAAGTALVILGGMLWLLGPNRRRELAYPLARKTWLLTASFVALCLAVGQITVVQSRENLSEVGAATSAVFENTPLEGARITGRLSGVIDTYGGQLLGVYEENENFYAQANVALAEAFDARELVTERDSEIARSVARTILLAPPAPEEANPEQPDSDVSASGADGTNSGTSGSAEAAEQERKQNGAQRSEPDLVTMLVISDLHCNVGMAPLITTAAKRSGATVILNAGDTTINGTELERFCVESFVSAAPKGTDFIQADGNHDSAFISKQAQKAGATVLDGSVVDIQGVKFLGDSDPNETRIGAGSVSVSGENYESAGARLTEVACASDGVDILLIHTPNVGLGPLESGCVPYQISGHTHRRGGPEFVGQGIRYTNSTTAGAMANKVTIGPLNGVAEMTILTYDRANKEMVSLQIVSVTPSATATVGPPLRFPQPGDNFLPAFLTPEVLPQEEFTEDAPEPTTQSDENSRPGASVTQENAQGTEGIGKFDDPTLPGEER